MSSLPFHSQPVDVALSEIASMPANTINWPPALNRFTQSGEADDWVGRVNSSAGVDIVALAESQRRIERIETARAVCRPDPGSVAEIYAQRPSGEWARLGIPRSVHDQVLVRLVNAGAEGVVFSGPMPDYTFANHQTQVKLLRSLGLIISSGTAPDRCPGGSAPGYRYTLHTPVCLDRPAGVSFIDVWGVVRRDADEFADYKSAVIDYRRDVAFERLERAIAEIERLR